MKPFIVYYSYSGITRRLAEDIALITDGELRELKPERPYSFSYNTAVKEAREEIEKGYCPPLIQIQGAEAIKNAELIFYRLSELAENLCSTRSLVFKNGGFERKDHHSLLHAWRRRLWEND